MASDWVSWRMSFEGAGDGDDHVVVDDVGRKSGAWESERKARFDCLELPRFDGHHVQGSRDLKVSVNHAFIEEAGAAGPEASTAVEAAPS